MFVKIEMKVSLSKYAANERKGNIELKNTK